MQPSRVGNRHNLSTAVAAAEYHVRAANHLARIADAGSGHRR
jgi:hypothetical protein